MPKFGPKPPEETYEASDQSAVDVLVIEVIKDELLRQSRVAGSLYTRSTILVGASGISSALLTREDLPAEWLLPFTCFVASIILAILSLRFPTGQTIDPGSLAASKNEMSLQQAHETVITALQEVHQDGNSSIHHRKNLLTAGMIVFGVGWSCALIILIVQAV